MSGEEPSEQVSRDEEADLELDAAAAEAVKGGTGGDDDPTESVSLNFGRIRHQA